MAIKYQTGVSTLIQFLSVTFLNFITLITSSIHSCIKGSSCLGDTTINLLYFLVLSAWFAFIWVLGYAAQDRRSKRLAQLLIAAEIIIFLAALLDIKHHNDILGLITSLVDASLAAWTILLAYRLMRAGGGRVTTRARRRPTKVNQ
ncbi:MAG TPA: hypothetical protein VFI84_04075 [Candidatus Saccharimonadales bacterium]|nr:hypothetical protein [Candidatus Saccharimonadales bacterium]